VKTNLSCDDCRRELTALVDGAIHPAVARALQSHVEECAGCRARLEEHRAIAAWAARLPAIEAPAWLEGRVVAAVTRPARLRLAVRRAGAAALAASFAVTIGLLALYPRLAAHFGLPSAGSALANAVGGTIDFLVAIPKQVASEVLFYEPMARQVWLAFHTLAALPRAALVVLQSPDVQVAGVLLLTLGVAIYWILRPSRRHERGIGHACLAL
jgi:anti-sigma factor RsiW